MHVRTLGRAELSANGTRLGPEAKVAFPLLLHLVLERDHWVARTQLQEMLFPEQDRLHARHSLRQSVYTLRKEGFPIEGSGPALHIPAKAIVDDYSTLLTPQLEGERELTDLMGGWLAGFEPTISKQYSHWFEGKRGEVALGMRATLLTELVAHKRNARWTHCERTCRAILTLDPLNEEATLGLAEALALTGAKLQAIRILERYQEEMPNADLRLSAGILTRRISERLPAMPSDRAPTPLLGREREMEVISTALSSGLNGVGSGILIAGDAGMGKSRLIAETERIGIISGFRVASHVCQPQDRERPLGVFTSMIPRLRAMKGALGCDPEAIPLLARLEAIPDAQPASTLISTDWAQYANSVAWAIQDLVSALIVEGPLLILIDDAHLADPASLSILSSLLLRSDRRLVIVMGTRRQSVARCLPGGGVRLLQLRPLPSDAARELFLTEFGRRIDRHEHVEWAESVGAGNPLFLITLARHMSAHPESRRLPTAMEHLLEERLGDLSASDAQIFATICALGRHANFRMLQHTLAMPHHELLGAVGRLEDQGFTQNAGDKVEPSHPLFAERALERLPRSARHFMFHLAAEAVAANVEKDDITAMWDVVHMTRRSGAVDRALARARQLARHALAIGRPAEACSLLAEMRSIAVSKTEISSLVADIAVSARAAGRWKLAKDAAEELVALGDGDDLTGSELRFVQAEADWHLTHEYLRIAPHLQACIVDDGLSQSSRHRAAELLLISAVNLNDAALGHGALDAAKATATTDHDLGHLASRMIFEMSFGSVQEAAHHARQLIRCVNSSPLTIHSIRHLCNGATALWFSGDAESALHVLQEGFDLGHRYNLQAGAWRCANEISNIFLALNRIDEAAEWAERVDQASSTTDSGVDSVITQELRFWNLILKGDAAEALPLAESMRKAASQRSGRSAALALAAYTLARQMVYGEAEPDLVRLTKVEYLAHRGSLEAELWTWAVAEVLARSGDLEGAFELAEDYVNSARREQGLIRSALSQYIQSGSTEATIRDSHQGQAPV